MAPGVVEREATRIIDDAIEASEDTGLDRAVFLAHVKILYHSWRREFGEQIN